MLSGTELNKACDAVQDRLQQVNTLYLKKIAAQIRKIGEMNQTSINRMVVMAEIIDDATEITKALQAATSLNIKQVQALYTKALQDVYTDPRFTRAFAAGLTVPTVDRERLIQYTRSVAMQTAVSMINLSNTTAVLPTYQATADRAIWAVSSGLDSYSGAMRDAIRQLGYAGMQVHYASGYHRRLDTAIRQNIVDGTRQIAMHGAQVVGEILGYDAVEISAHARSAPDHEPVQGRVFLNAEFAKMQAGQAFSDTAGHSYKGFRRPIAEWNCMHFALPFSTTYSKPRWTDAQLQAFHDDNHAGVDIDGKTRTKYECVQMMRKIETEVRKQKDLAIMATAANDQQLREECQLKINGMMAKYGQIAKAAGLTEHRNRTVVEGFRPVKLKKAAAP